MANASRSRLVDWSPPAAPPTEGSKSSVTSTKEPSTTSNPGTVGPVIRPVWVMPNGSAMRASHLVGPRPAGDLLDDVAQHDVVGVRVAVRAARLAHPPGGVGDGDQLGRRPLAGGLADDRGLIEVLAEPAGVVEELAGRDPVRPRQVGDVAVDAAVQIETTLVGELQHDDGDERLGGAADVPRHVGIDGPLAGSSVGVPTLASLTVPSGSRTAMRAPTNSAAAWWSVRMAVQLRLERRIGRHHRR